VSHRPRAARATRATRAIAAAALFALAASPACDSPGGAGGAPLAPPGGHDAGAQGGGGTSQGGHSAGGAGGQGGAAPLDCPGYERPPLIPEGWVPYGDWPCDCRIYYAPSPELMPPPIVWEPCPQNPDPDVECQSMVVDWNNEPDSPYTIAVHPRFSHTESGEPLLAIRRIATHPSGEVVLFDMIAEADGAVLWSFATYFESGYAASKAGCLVHTDGLSEQHAVFGARGTHHDEDYSDRSQQGALVGLVGERPGVALAYQGNDYVHSFGSSKFDHANGVPDAFVVEIRLEASERWAYPFADPSAGQLIHSVTLDPQGLPASNLVALGDVVFFDTQGGVSNGINLWRPSQGFVPFRRWLGDPTRGAASFGTDGVDMVWVEGEGKAPGAVEYPVANFVRAPFTLDPAAVAPTIVRPWAGPFSHKPTVVGCGRAARDGGVTYVIDLDDGSWKFVPLDVDTFLIGTPMGLTCDEVFVLGSPEGKTNIFRFKLATMKPGPA
jgi:hypothetical protein